MEREADSFSSTRPRFLFRDEGFVDMVCPVIFSLVYRDTDTHVILCVFLTDKYLDKYHYNIYDILYDDPQASLA